MALRRVVPSLFLQALLWTALPHSASAVSEPAAGLGRPHDPVIVSGAQLAALPLRGTSQLLLRRVVAGRFEPIRFQFDARDEDGELVVDGADAFDLDDNDELVFMAKDAGERATPTLLPEDSEAILEIELADPLREKARAWAYLFAYRHPEPAPAFEPYVRFDLERREARSDFYRVSYAEQRNFFTGIEIPRSGGGNEGNLLRQTRMRGSPTFSFLFADLSFDFTEQNSIVQIEGVRTGPVRAVRRVRLSVDLGALFPDLPSGTAYTYHYPTSYLTPTEIAFPWIMVQTLKDFRFENVFEFRDEALPLRYFDAWYPDGIALSPERPLELRTAEDREWWVHSGATGTVLHAFVIPEPWRRWGVVRGTVVRAGVAAGAEEDAKSAPGGPSRFAAGYTLLNMTQLQKAGSYDLLMASVVLPRPFEPGDESTPMAMLTHPLAITVRRLR